MRKIFRKSEVVVANYDARNEKRELTLITGTMNFVGYFMNLGDDQQTANDKVGQLSDEVASFLYAYRLGRTQTLIDAINASTLPFMDADAKAFIVNQLTTN